MNPIQFVDYDSRFLELSWNWLADPEIKQLTLTPDFTRDSQAEWFATLPNRSDYVIRGIEYNANPIGAVGLKRITAVDAEYWGYIGDKSYWNRGIGGHMVQFGVDEAKRRGLKTVYLKVGEGNTRAIKVYERGGFTRVGCEGGVLKLTRELS